MYNNFRTIQIYRKKITRNIFRQLKGYIYMYLFTLKNIYHIFFSIDLNSSKIIIHLQPFKEGKL